MKASKFIEWVADCEKQYGSRPSMVTLSSEDVRELLGDLQSASCSRPAYWPPVRIDNAGYRAPVERPGFSLRMLGVDVYRSVDVAPGEFRLD